VAVFQERIRLRTKGRCDVIDITGEVRRIVQQSGLRAGVVNVAGVGSTLGVTTLEYEPGCVADLKRALDAIAPANSNYAHNARWGDDNGYAHLRSALVGATKTFPVAGGEVVVGTWQDIVLCEFDDRPGDRQVVVTVVGES